jgi:putative spermidine/putrescine transport system substrate-binding protein
MKQRSNALSMALIAGTVAAIAAMMPARAGAADVTVTAFGGAWEQSFRKCYVEPHTARTGQSVEVIIGGPPQWVAQIAANPSQPPIDVLVNLMDTARLAIDQGLVEPLDAGRIPNLAKVDASFQEPLGGYGTVINYGSAGLAYNKEKIGEPPASWKEFFQGAIDGKYVAALPGINIASTTPTALIWNMLDLYGANIDDADPVYAMLKQLRDSGNVVFYNDLNQFLTMIQSGEADIGPYWDGRAWVAHDGGMGMLDFYYPKEGGIINPSVIQKVKNGSDKGWDFIDTLLTAENQGCFAEAISYAVVNKDVAYSDTLKSRLADPASIRWPDFGGVAKRMPAWVDRWNREIGQ